MEIVLEVMAKILELKAKIKMANFRILELKDILVEPNKSKVTTKLMVKQEFILEILNKWVAIEGIQVEQGAIRKMIVLVKLEAVLTLVAIQVTHIVD
jgi:hypothetical protein